MTTTDVFDRYESSLAAGDMEALAAVLAEDVRWHQPGANPLSGTHVGRDAVLALLGRFMELSAGTFRLTTTSTMVNGDQLAATVRFEATREGRAPLAQTGVDVFRTEGEHVAEVWLFSEDQAAEDTFWG